MSRQNNVSSDQEVELTNVDQWSRYDTSLLEEDENVSSQKSATRDFMDSNIGGLNDDEQKLTLRQRWAKSWKVAKNAGNMTLARAALLVCLSFFFVLTTSLLVTGFQGLLPALLQDGVYSNLCDSNQPIVNPPSLPPSNSDSFESHVYQASSILARTFDSWSKSLSFVLDRTFGITMMSDHDSALHNVQKITVPNSNPATCTKQRLRLNLMLTVAVTCLNLVCFPFGILVDRFGPRWVGLIGSIFSILGSALFAVSDSRKFDAYIPAYALLGVGGVAIFISLFHLLNLFPVHRGLLTTFYTATEDASTGVFYFFRLLHKHGFSLKSLFLAYTVVPLAHLGVVALQPSKVILNEQGEDTSEFYPISLQPLKKQAFSIQFWGVMIWNAVMCVTSYFYLSTLNAQLVWLFQSQELANKGAETFSFLFMVCPFVAVPFTGWILDRLGTWPSLLFVALQCGLYGLLACVKVWWVQYITWTVFVVNRASFIGVSAHYVNQMFGQNFSTLVGMMWTAGGIGTLTNHLWVYIALDVFKSQFLVMNLIMTATSVGSTVLLAIVVKRSLGVYGEHYRLDESPKPNFAVSEDLPVDVYNDDQLHSTSSDDNLRLDVKLD